MQNSEARKNIRASAASVDSETEQLFGATRGSKVAARIPAPFEAFWGERHAEPDSGYVVKSNAYERSLLKHVALSTGESVHGLVRRLAREAALRIAMGEGRR